MSRALSLRKILLFLGDVILLYLSLLGTVFFGFWGEFSWKLFYIHFLPFSILYFFWVIIFYIFGLYDLNLIKIRGGFYQRISGSMIVSLILGMVFFYLSPFFDITPKTNLVLNVFILAILILGWRELFYFLFSSYFLTGVVIVGENPQAKELKNFIQQNPQLGYKPIACIPILPGVDPSKDLNKILKEERVDTLIVATDLSFEPQLTKALYQWLPLRLNFMDLSRAYETICEKIPVSFVNHIWFLENLREGEKIFYDKIKRGLDLVFATFLLILTLPLWPIISLAIKLEDGGPIFYRQERIGKDKKPFLLNKFRSMKVGAEKGKPVWAKKEDPRVTKVGKFLRQTHLDELPQMINVIRGDISLVGPRPERPAFVQKLEKEIPHYHLRHLIKPGFTGWAQIKFRYGRSVMDSHEKFQYDLYYLKNRSFILDLGILLKTFQLFFKKE